MIFIVAGISAVSWWIGLSFSDAATGYRTGYGDGYSAALRDMEKSKERIIDQIMQETQGNRK